MISDFGSLRPMKQESVKGARKRASAACRRRSVRGPMAGQHEAANAAVCGASMGSYQQRNALEVTASELGFGAICPEKL